MTNQLIFDFPVTAKLTFATFVVCDGNRSGAAFAARLAAHEGAEMLLYLYGPSGSGKSHLLQAAAAELGTGELPAPSLSFKEGVGISPKALLASIDRRFTGAPALLLDDIQLAPPDPAIRVPLWQLFNDFYTAGRPIIICGNVSPKELTNLDDHLISRLLWGLAARIDSTDDDSRRMIMKKLAADRNIKLPADVIDYLLTRLPRRIPELIAALDRITRFALATKRKLTVQLAREALDTPLPRG